MHKKNFKLAIILVVLIALAYLYQGPFQEWKNNLGKPDNFLAGIDVSQIDKIEIVKNNEITILERQDNKWKIAGTKNFYVEENLASSLNKALEEAVIAEVELASSNKDKKGEFKTDLDQGVEVRLHTPNSSQEGNSKVVADFIVGKSGSNFASTYISESNSDETYKIKASLTNLFSRESWYDKIIFSSDMEKIFKIRFQYSDREFNIEKIGGEWAGILPYEFDVDNGKTDAILDVMSNLVAVEIPEQKFDGTGLEKNLIIVQVAGEGIDNTLMVGDDNGEELFYAKKGDSDNIYLIAKDQRDELDKNIQDLR